MTKIGFIGCGKMAGAIIKGIIKSGFITSENVLASKCNPDNLQDVSKKLGIKIILDNKKVAEFGDIIFIGVKPNQVKDVLNEIKNVISPDKLVVSMAAGVKISDIENIFSNTKVIRVMPNTPVLVNSGMTGITGGKYVSISDIKQKYACFPFFITSIAIETARCDFPVPFCPARTSHSPLWATIKA